MRELRGIGAWKRSAMRDLKGIFFVGLAAQTLLTFLAAPAVGEDVLMLAQNYTASHNIQFDPIGINAEGLLVGLDYPGEWVEFHFTVRRFGISSAFLAIRGNSGLAYSMTMELRGDISSLRQSIEFDFIGAGYG